MRISFRTESDATRGIRAEQNIRAFRPNECCDVGLSELEAMSALAGPRLRADHGPFGRDHREGLQPCSWRGVPFRSDVRRTPPRKATQIPGRSSPAGRSPVGRRPPACHNDPPGATRPSPKDAPSDAPAYLAFSASVPTPRG